MHKGSKVVVCNTIRNAALIAECFRGMFGDDYVKHISTCLTPKDRMQILDSVKDRLENEPNRDWVLVATSCVEAGVDISFNYGFRENSSLMSVMQLAGRVSRKNEFKECKIVVFELFLEIVRNSIQLYESQVESNPVERLKTSDFYVWRGKYDNFLGYQAEHIERFSDA